MTTQKTHHIVVDIETLGLTPGSVILSIGAYDPSLCETFYCTIDVLDSLSKGYQTDPKTAAWWVQQDPSVREETFSGRCSVQAALADFTAYVTGFDGPVCLWGNAPSFDLTMLGAAYDKEGLPRPWGFRQERCFRTLQATLDFLPKIERPITSMAHNALCDAAYEAHCLAQMLSAIESLKEAQQ